MRHAFDKAASVSGADGFGRARMAGQARREVRDPVRGIMMANRRAAVVLVMSGLPPTPKHLAAHLLEDRRSVLARLFIEAGAIKHSGGADIEVIP